MQMQQKFWINGIKLSIAQVLSMVAALISIFFGLIAFQIVSAALKIIQLDGILSKLIPNGYVLFLPVTLFTYSLIWYLVIKYQYSSGKINLRELIIFSLLPNLVLTPFFFYQGFFTKVDPTGCGFIYPRDIFYCLFYSLVLFPVFSWGLVEKVLPVKSKFQKCRNISLLILSLFTILAVLILITVFIIEPNAPEQFIKW
jgi:hypothetical protein